MSPQVYGESVEIGDEIGPLIKRPDLKQVQAFLDAWPGEDDTRDSGRFVDAAEARLVGFPAPVVPGNMTKAYVAQLLTDWAAPSGWLRSLDVNFRRPALHDEDLTCLALVTDVRPEGEQTLVRVDVYCENARGDRPLQGVGAILFPTSS